MENKKKLKKYRSFKKQIAISWRDMIRHNEINTNERFQADKSRIENYTEEHKGKSYMHR